MGPIFIIKEYAMTRYITPDLCDEYPDLVQVVEPMFTNYGGIESFGGEIVTVKCYEDNSKVKELVEQDGKGKVMVIDGGASMRKALLGDINVPVKFGGVEFIPGQYVYADNNGVIVS